MQCWEREELGHMYVNAGVRSVNVCEPHHGSCTELVCYSRLCSDAAQRWCTEEMESKCNL